jgi:hypothetical protein
MSNILFTKKFITKLTAIIRNFWWTGIREETNSRNLCLKAWKDICSPKNEGGLGIRNLQAMNQGLILMAAWRIADQPNNFLNTSQILLFRDQSPVHQNQLFGPPL